MSSERVTKSSVPNLPALLGAHAAPDPAPDTPVNLLVYPSEQRRKLGALCERYKIIPPYVLVGLENGDVPFIRMRSYMEIRAMFRDCAASLADRNMLAYKAFLLFGHAQRLEAFERNWGQDRFPKLGRCIPSIWHSPHAHFFPARRDADAACPRQRRQRVADTHKICTRRAAFQIVHGTGDAPADRRPVRKMEP